MSILYVVLFSIATLQWTRKEECDVVSYWHKSKSNTIWNRISTTSSVLNCGSGQLVTRLLLRSTHLLFPSQTNMMLTGPKAQTVSVYHQQRTRSQVCDLLFQKHRKFVALAAHSRICLYKQDHLLTYNRI